MHPLLIREHRLYNVHHFTVFINVSPAHGELDTELIGHVDGVGGGTGDVLVELKSRRILAPRLELLRGGSDRGLHAVDDLGQEGLERHAGLIGRSHREHNRVVAASREEDGETGTGDDELVVVGITDASTSPLDALVTRLQRRQDTQPINGQVVVVGEMGALHIC